MLLGRRLRSARPLSQWHAGRPDADRDLHALRGRTILAAAGIGHPQRFFDMLRAQGLTIAPLPLPDHHDFDVLPWPPGTTEVLVTEKDAVKIAPASVGATQVWVVGLDLQLPEELCTALRALLPPPPTATDR
jgi:tetraacyldisaccharide 4'-kinase